MTRRAVGLAALALLGALIAVDLAGGARLDPFVAPAPIALGSGQAVGGSHCSALPD